MDEMIVFHPRGEGELTSRTWAHILLMNVQFPQRRSGRQADPQVVHEYRESDHHGSNAPWYPKLPSHEQLKMSLGETGVETVANETHLV
jgi:hypothetical protein